MLEVDHDFATAIFNCNYSCNDTCNFCFNKKLLNKAPEMTLSEIKNNFYYLKDRYNIYSVIISGGEPSLYSNFWEMMDFFYKQTKGISPSLNTNSLNFAPQEAFQKLLQFLKNSQNPNKRLSLSFSSVNDLKNPSAIEQQKLKGLSHTIQAGLLSNTITLVVLAITKDNYRALADMADFLVKHAEKYSKTRPLNVQLRGLYLGNYMDQEQTEASFPKSFKDIKKHVINFITSIQKSKKIILRIFNIPLCLIQDEIDISYFSQKSRLPKELRMNVAYNKQFSRIKPNTFQESAFSTKACEQCSLAGRCNRVQQEYLDIGFIDELKPA